MAQFRDWEEFREFQKRVRYDYGTLERPFSEYVDRVRKRRQRHGLEGDVPLRFSLGEKDRKLENWIEFQAFHIRFSIEPLEKKISSQKAAMDSLQKKADSADAAVSKKAAETIKFNQPAETKTEPAKGKINPESMGHQYPDLVHSNARKEAVAFGRHRRWTGSPISFLFKAHSNNIHPKSDVNLFLTIYLYCCRRRCPISPVEIEIAQMQLRLP